MRHLYVATPSYHSAVAIGYCQSILMTLIACTKARIALSGPDFKGGPYVDESRNWLVHRFLKTEADTLLFLDDDITWDEAAVVKCYESRLDVVGGVYPFKQDSEGYPVKLLERVNGDYREAMYLPGGFLMIRREVFEKMRPTVPSYPDPSSAEETVHAYFENLVFQGKGRVGEDVTFCNRWRKLGGLVWCLPDIHFEHQGPKQWKGNLAQHLEAKRWWELPNTPQPEEKAA